MITSLQSLMENDGGLRIGPGNVGYLKADVVAPLKLEIKGTPDLGYGVFAREDIVAGEVIEECVIFSDRIPAIYDNHIMATYTYRGIEVPGLPGKYDYVLLGGYGCLYNHSNDGQNIEIGQDLNYERIMFVRAIKDIKAGEQCLWNYGYDPALEVY